MPSGLQLLSELLTRYGEQPLMTRRVIQGGGGALLGSLAANATGGDPVTGAMLGGALGVGTAGSTPPEQWQPSDAIIGPELERWKAIRETEPSTLTLRQRGLSALYDAATPWKDRVNALVQQGILPDASANDIYQTKMGGGFGQVKAELDPLTKTLGDLRDEGLLDALRTRLGFAQERHPWAVLGDRLSSLESDWYRAIGSGDRARAADLGAQVADLRTRMAGRDVSYGGSIPTEIASRQTAFENELGPERLAKVNAALEQIKGKVGGARDVLEQAGLLDPEFAKTLRAREAAGDVYVPGWRQQAQEFDPLSGTLVSARKSVADRLRSRMGASVKSIEPLITTLEGSKDLAYEDPLRNVMNFVAEAHKESQRNLAGKAMITAVAQDPALASSGAFRALRPGEALQPGEGKVAFFQGGKAQEFAVPAEMADSLNFAHANDVARGLKTLGTFMRVNNRMLTTANLGFLLRNVPRDVSDALLLTSKGALPTLNELATFSSAWKNALIESLRDEFKGEMSAGRERFLRSGAAFSTLSSSLRETSPWEAAIEGPQSGVGQFFDRLQKFQGAFEDATKRATFETLLSQGKSDLEAAAITRKFGGSPDFFQRGTLGSQAGVFYQFFNPQVQGIGRFVEAAKANPLILAKKMAGLTTALSALTAWNRQAINPDTGRPDYENIPQSERLNNLIIMNPTETFIDEQGQKRFKYLRIPLGHVARVLLAPIYGVLDAINGDPLAPTAAQAASNTISQLLPLSGAINTKHPIASTVSQLGSGLNPMLRVPLEQAANQTFFNQVPIVGQRVARLQPGYQYTEDTWPVAIFLAQKVFPWLPYLNSPDRVEHVLRAFLPGPGEQVLSPLNASPSDYTQDFRKIPVLGPIARSFVESGQSAPKAAISEDFYSRMNDAAEAVATANRLKSEKRGSELEDFAANPENVELVRSNPKFTKIAKLLSQVSRERERLIRETPAGPDRDEALHQLWLRQMQILQGQAQPLVAALQ